MVSYLGDDFWHKIHSFSYREWPESFSILPRNYFLLYWRQIRVWKQNPWKGSRFSLSQTHIYTHISSGLCAECMWKKYVFLGPQGCLLTRFHCIVESISLTGIKLSPFFHVCERGLRMSKIHSLKKSTEYNVWRVDFWTLGAVVSLRSPKKSKWQPPCSWAPENHYQKAELKEMFSEFQNSQKYLTPSERLINQKMIRKPRLRWTNSIWNNSSFSLC